MYTFYHFPNYTLQSTTSEQHFSVYFLPFSFKLTLILNHSPPLIYCIFVNYYFIFFGLCEVWLKRTVDENRGQPLFRLPAITVQNIFLKIYYQYRAQCICLFFTYQLMIFFPYWNFKKILLLFLKYSGIHSVLVRFNFNPQFRVYHLRSDTKKMYKIIWLFKYVLKMFLFF